MWKLFPQIKIVHLLWHPYISQSTESHWWIRFGGLVVIQLPFNILLWNHSEILNNICVLTTPFSQAQSQHLAKPFFFFLPSLTIVTLFIMFGLKSPAKSQFRSSMEKITFLNHSYVALHPNQQFKVHVWLRIIFFTFLQKHRWQAYDDAKFSSVNFL